MEKVDSDNWLPHNRYIECPKEEADAHCWVFKDKDTFSFFPCKFPAPSEEDIRIRVLYTGLCMSDVKSGRLLWSPKPYPLCAGHEVIGEVTWVGKEVSNRKVGDKVAVGPFRDSCGYCEQCKETATNVCTGMSGGFKKTYFYKFGGYSTMVQIRSDFCFTLPEGTDLATAAPLGCAGITVFRPLVRNVKPGQKVAVLGIGGLGHLGIQFAAKLGCKVTGFTRTESKTQMIKELGAEEVIIVDENLKNLESHENEFDHILNTLPVSDGAILNAYLKTIKPGGKLLQVGIPDKDVPMQLSFGLLVCKQIEIVGSLVGSVQETQEMFNFSAEHGVKCMVETFSFEDFPKALELLEHGRPKFRCVVNVGDYCKKNGF